MADRYTWDLETPHPNVEIEAIRVATLQAIEDISTAVAGVDDGYFLSDLLFSLLDSALADLDALTARVAALEPPPADPPLEVP